MNEIPNLQIEVENAAQNAADILLEYDRLEENPDRLLLKEKISDQLLNNGFITLTVFSCMDWQPEKLTSNLPESFIADSVRDQDLFVPRVKKLKEIQTKLQERGFLSKLVIVLGDTDLEDYFLNLLENSGLILNREVLLQRELRYKASFVERVRNCLRPNTEVIFWSDIKDVYKDIFPNDPSLIAEDIETMKQSYMDGRVFKELNLKFDQILFEISARERVNMYAQQGQMVNDLFGGIILQTETPWLLRARMLKATCSDIAIIYPWIRTEDTV